MSKRVVTRRQVFGQAAAAGLAAGAIPAVLEGTAQASMGSDPNAHPTAQQHPAPYPPSRLVRGISWDFGGRLRFAHGSDLWPVTWGADGSIYTSWGDGGGFGGTNGAGRTSLGFARIDDDPATLSAYYDYGGTNLWGGLNAVNPAQFTGKCPGLVSVDGVLYAWINLEDYGATAATWSHQLAYSTDSSTTWQKAPVVFPGVVGGFAAETWLQYGPDYAGAPDEFVYVYGIIWGNANVASTMKSVYLMRIPRDQILNQSSYQFFAGLDHSGDPTWRGSVSAAKPIFTDPLGGVDINQVVYNPGLKRYIMTVPHSFLIGGLGIFEGQNPWGPWRTIAYYSDWGGFTGPDLEVQFPAKWISSDGKTMWLIFSSTGPLDSFNLMQAALTV